VELFARASRPVYHRSMLRTFMVLLFCTSSVLAAEMPPALDTTDESAIDLALRAIKMTERDLSFSKTNAESELVLGKTRRLLQEPLSLPLYGQFMLSNCASVASLADLARFTGAQLELPPRLIDVEFQRLNVDPGFLKRLPLGVAHAVQRVVDASSEARILIDLALPPERAAPFAAFAADTFQLDKDEAEVDRWQQAGIDTTTLREIVRRDNALELQDAELADAILSASDKFDEAKLMIAFETLTRGVDDAVAELRTNTFTEEFQVETDTSIGKIIIGGVGRNVYTNEAFLIIDLGGDDVHENSAGGANGLVGRPISIVIDLAGNDQYVSRRSFSQGSGVFGIGLLVDCGGDDVYEAKHLSQGAGFFGCGLLADYCGHDKFEADTFVQGAAEFGAGILWQRSDDTTYKATELAQGFGGTSGFGLLLDGDGNDSYFAGGKYPCGWLPGHFFSLSQGFGYGMRPFTGGGIGILCDLHGNDHYVADVYGQGASYWYSTGLLLDGEGNDTYEAYQYCQGAGIHLSSGALIDWRGNDTYTAGHICQGGAHDYSVGTLLDLAGNDRYEGDTTAQGSAINNSFALLLDRSGNDTYIGKDRKQSQAAGHDGDKREYGSIALLLDLAGHDKYSQGQSNNTVWLKPLYGAGLDTEMATPAVPIQALSPTFSLKSADATPSKRLYIIEPVDPHQPIEHLLRVAISDKPDAEAAWKELKQQGTNALPYLLTRLDTPNVLVRAKTEELIDFLGTNSIPALIEGIDHAKNDEVARLCCYFLARFNEKARAAISHVVPSLDRDKTRSIALYTLGHLRAHEAFESAIRALNSDRELVRLRAAQALGRIGDKRAIRKLVAALDDEMWDVRYAAEDALVAFGKPSIGPLREAYTKVSARARPHIIEALAKLGDMRALALAQREYRNDDPLVRAAVMQSLQAAVAGAK
jgi:hypothetical protein